MIVTKGGISVDDRGSIRFVNDFDFAGVKRFYQVENYQVGFVRAWHGHRVEAKYVYVLRGSILLATLPLKTSVHVTRPINLEKRVLSSANPSTVYIPPGYYNGFMTLEQDTIVQFFSTTTFEWSFAHKEDDIRVPAFTWDVWGIERK